MSLLVLVLAMCHSQQFVIVAILYVDKWDRFVILKKELNSPFQFYWVKLSFLSLLNAIICDFSGFCDWVWTVR